MSTPFFFLVILSLVASGSTSLTSSPILPLKTPQFILFTYSGQISEKVRFQLFKAFPSSIKNPDGCKIRITVFVVGQEADPCTVHLLYYRGHEIALSGINTTSRVDNWESSKWKDSIKGQQELMVNTSNIRQSDMVGMRVRDFFPGKNAQYDMLNDNGFVYDSSFLVATRSRKINYWPFEITQSNLNSIHLVQGFGPNGTFPGLWEVPVSRLYSSQIPGLMCTYLDECFRPGFDSKAVRDLLDSHTFNGAPLHVNLRERSLQSGAIVDGILQYLTAIRRYNDTWIVSIRDLVKWMKSPTDKEFLVPMAFWECPDRTGVHCTENSNNYTLIRVTFSKVLKVEDLVIWQTLLLIVLYIVVYQYDRYMDNKNK